ncbi:MAG TPA: ClpXP protease specificity-enhancing factor SspB [Candidatus Cybelea sp.]|nr:ClpXP protease specificity-enhancing factor SspB [Candidatus Cybelea sp.]
MGTDSFDYHRMMEDALRGVVREALIRAKERGLPGNHHFYISFRTAAPGVSIPEYLATRYPDEMTIVMQHQFWGLEVEDAGFAVTLSFNKMQERLRIPYAAVTAFADPSVPFGLQFRGGEPAKDTVPPAHLPVPAQRAEDPAAQTAAADKKTGEVVTLDAFRKK